MPVELTEPTVVQAVPEKVYNIAWYKDIVIRTAGPTTGTAYFERIPCTAQFELHPSASAEFRVSNLWECIAEVPEAAQAMESILAALPKIELWLAAKEAERLAALED